MKHTLPGQIDLPNCPTQMYELGRRLARQGLRPQVPQKPCDHGLFSSDADQLDLVEMLQDPTNGE